MPYIILYIYIYTDEAYVKTRDKRKIVSVCMNECIYIYIYNSLRQKRKDYQGYLEEKEEEELLGCNQESIEDFFRRGGWEVVSGFGTRLSDSG